MKSFKLEKTPHVNVVINGNKYQAQANATIILKIKQLNKLFETFDVDTLADTSSDSTDALEQLAEELKQLIVITFGQKGYKDLLQGHELDVFRLTNVFEIITEVYNSNEMTALIDSLANANS